MEGDAAAPAGIAGPSKRLGQRMLALGENRLELLLLELQEERERVFHGLILVLAAAAFGLLAGIALSVTLVVVFWRDSPAMTALALTVLYGGAGTVAYVRFRRLLRDWQTLPETFNQLRRDREALSDYLA
jgi:uncharacterized membrane protein YqjE